MSTAGRPVPVPDEGSAPFWEAAAAGQLVLARCSSCQRWVHPPEPVCPRCGTSEPAYTWEPAPAQGSIRSWTVIRQSFLPGFEDDLPFVLADVALGDDGDLRLIGRLLDGPGAAFALGDQARVEFEQLPDGAAVPAFALVQP